MFTRVEIESESGTSRAPASVKVYEGDKLVTTIIATVEMKQGADGGLYPCVTLKQQP